METSSPPPSTSHGSRVADRRPFGRPPIALWVIIGINIVVFLAWRTALGSGKISAAMFMESNFLVSTARLHEGAWWTLITSAFSHYEFWHIGINMVVLWSFGSLLERLWGTRVFVVFYLTAAVIASLSHCAVSSLLLGDGTQQALGASGAVSGLLIAYALTFPRHRILLFGVIPIPALVGVLGFIAIDLWGLSAQTRGGGLPIGHGAHLGGALAGGVMYVVYLRDRFRERIAAMGRRTGPALTREEAIEFERIRLKLDEYGPQALTPKEQDFLRRLRERLMGGADG